MLELGCGALATCAANGDYSRLAADAGPADAPSNGGSDAANHDGDGGTTVSGGTSATGGAPASGGGATATGGTTAGNGAAGGAAGGPGGHGPASTGGAAMTGGHAGQLGSAGSGGTSGATGGTAGTRGSGGTSGATGGTAGTRGSGGTGGAASGGTPGTGGAATGAGGATQRILSLDFVGGMAAGGAGGINGAIAMSASETAGVKPAKNWNSAPGAAGSLSPLVLSDGAPATGAAVSWNAPNYTGNWGIYTLGYPDAPGDVRMMNGCLNPSWTGTPPSSPVTVVSFAGLPASITSGGYDVYVYVLGGIPGTDSRVYSYTIGSTTFEVMQTGPTPAPPPSPYPYLLAPNMGAGNYVVFRQVTGAAFDLKVQPGSGLNVYRSPINGIQIVWPTGS